MTLRLGPGPSAADVPELGDHEGGPGLVDVAPGAGVPHHDGARFTRDRAGPEIAVVVPAQTDVRSVRLTVGAEQEELSVLGQRKILDVKTDGLGPGRGDFRGPDEAVTALLDHA